MISVKVGAICAVFRAPAGRSRSVAHGSLAPTLARTRPLKRCSPDDLNWVIVRENSAGEDSGVGGRVHQGHPIEAATDVSMMTRAGIERIMRFAFKLAQSRPR